jgi:hypothetical protein
MWNVFSLVHFPAAVCSIRQFYGVCETRKAKHNLTVLTYLAGHAILRLSAIGMELKTTKSQAPWHINYLQIN